MPEQIIAGQSVAGALGRGTFAARHSSGKMLRTLSGARGSPVASRSTGKMFRGIHGRGVAAARHSPGARTGRLRRSPGKAIGPASKSSRCILAKRSPSDVAPAYLETRKGVGSAVATQTTGSSLRSLVRAGSAAAKRTVINRKPISPEVAGNLARTEKEYRGPVYLGQKKRSFGAHSGMDLATTGGIMGTIPPLGSPGAYSREEQLKLKLKKHIIPFTI